MPYALTAWGIRRINQLERQPAIAYFHPWEFDPEQPRVESADVRSRFRHYLNLSRTRARLERLLTEFRWDRIDATFSAQLGGLQALPVGAPNTSAHAHARFAA